jgi:hypothetical protein
VKLPPAVSAAKPPLQREFQQKSKEGWKIKCNTQYITHFDLNQTIYIYPFFFKKKKEDSFKLPLSTGN